MQPLTEEQIMPNWCANRLRVTGLAENVSKVRARMEGEVRPLYARAEGQGFNWRHLEWAIGKMKQGGDV
ncbi:hypothetical protein N5E15_21955 [Pantoea stewartii]|uniref:hypothetical protein n=1 Tax=Pantoea stewartii TaxID=66269 RepID=UPI0021D4E64F|nr:hypothetical protein [Pantoea stewartii]MCU7369243.1 hypothetical protein [Pantoea stewartii]